MVVGNGGGEWWWGCAEGVSRVFTVVDQVRRLKNLRGSSLQTPKQWNQSILNGPNLRTGATAQRLRPAGEGLSPGVVSQMGTEVQGLAGSKASVPTPTKGHCSTTPWALSHGTLFHAPSDPSPGSGKTPSLKPHPTEL